MKNRLDILLTQKGLCESPSKALSLIMSGIVYVNGKKAEKAGMAYPENVQIEIKANSLNGFPEADKVR
jgi:23S rRNA (cytidine1920-2'-O)/16S rRNA (cytidine1409-2'-O)-methyltransferase